VRRAARVPLIHVERTWIACGCKHGDMYVFDLWKPVGTAKGGTAKGGTAQVSTAKVGTAKVGTAKGGTAQVGTAKVGTAKVGTAKGGTAKVGTAKVGTAKVGTAQVGTAKVGTAKVGTAKGGTARVRCYHCKPKLEPVGLAGDFGSQLTCVLDSASPAIFNLELHPISPSAGPVWACRAVWELV
jgi:hypothetical protein